MRQTVGIVIALAACILVLGGTRPVAAEEGAKTPRVITVSGEAEIKTAPDEVILILGVQTWDKDINVAKRLNDERVQRVVALAGHFGIDPKYVQTEQVHIEPRYHNGTYTDADFIGYFVRKTVVFTLKDVSKFEGLYTAALSAGATHVHGIEFRTTELRKHRDAARALAIQAAQEKAVALAGGLKQTVGEPQSIQENYSGWSAWYGSRWGGPMTQNVVQNIGGGAPSEEGTFAPGQISVTARVTVSFALE